MENTLTYRKRIPTEIINIGDLIMLDSATGYIQKAVLEYPCEYSINSSLVIGICVSSDNETPATLTINGGKSNTIERQEFNGGNSNTVETIIINGGDSTQNPREIIQVAYTGEQMVNVCGPIKIGDRLCISNQPGKAMSKDYLRQQYYNLRSIGKVIKIDKKNQQAKVLLDIE